MALLDTFLNAIGLARPIYPKPLEMVTFGQGACARFVELSNDWALHIDSNVTGSGHIFRFEEGPAQGPPPPDFEQAIVVSDDDLQRLTGLCIDHDANGWHLSLTMAFRSKETPNPESRIYLTDRMLCYGRPLYFMDKQQSPHFAAALLGIEGIKAVLFREHTVTIERTPNTAWDQLDSAVELAIKTYFLGCRKGLTPEEATDFRSPLEQEVLAVLEETILPAIHRDGGDLTLVGIEDGCVKVSLVGACKSCPASELTLKGGIEQTLKKHFPNTIHTVEAV